MSASLALSVSCPKGSRCFFVVVSVALFGRYTVLVEYPVVVKLSVSVIKCEVAPESIMIWLLHFSLHHAAHLVHFFDFFVSSACVLLIAFISSSSSSFSPSLPSFSGVQ